MRKKKNDTPETNYTRAVADWRNQVKDWLQAKHGRQQELANVMQVKRYAINDWFISQRKAPPIWVVFAVSATVITATTKTSTWADTVTTAAALHQAMEGEAP